MVSGPRAMLVLSLVVLGTIAAAPGMALIGPTEEQSQTTEETAPTQTMIVDLDQNGDARWTVTKTFSLNSRNETEAFDEVASDFEDGQTDDLGLASYRRASQLATNSTGREMTITNITRESSRTGTVTNGTGQLSISFTWTNFGRVESEAFHVDDVFATSPRWLDGLSADQQLIVRPPEGYRFFDASVSVTLRNGTIQWTGPRDFTDTTLSATFEKTGSVGPSGTATPNTTSGTSPGGNNASSFLWLGLVTLGAVLVGYLLVRDGDILEDPDDEGEPSTSHTDPSDGGPTRSTTPATEGTTIADSADETDDESESDTIDEALLSDEERVERLLEQNGGRMKQANIVKETNWSNAKVSQLLSSMEEEGEINKLRIGRENLISFPDEDITDLEK